MSIESVELCGNACCASGMSLSSQAMCVSEWMRYVCDKKRRIDLQCWTRLITLRPARNADSLYHRRHFVSKRQPCDACQNISGATSWRRAFEEVNGSMSPASINFRLRSICEQQKPQTPFKSECLAILQHKYNNSRVEFFPGHFITHRRCSRIAFVRAKKHTSLAAGFALRTATKFTHNAVWINTPSRSRKVRVAHEKH